MSNLSFTELPFAAPGLTSYRYMGSYGWIMIGAKTDLDALSEAGRSLTNCKPTIDGLQKWNGEKYEYVS